MYSYYLKQFGILFMNNEYHAILGWSGGKVPYFKMISRYPYKCFRDAQMSRVKTYIFRIRNLFSVITNKLLLTLFVKLLSKY